MSYGTMIKICGVTLPEDAARVAASGADFIGLNFWPKSKRYLAPDRAARVAGSARTSGAIKVVGVFVDASLEEVTAVTSQVDLDVIQLHGDESHERIAQIAAATRRPIWKSVAVGSASDLEYFAAWPDVVLLDTPSPGKGGSGKTFDWKLAAEAVRSHPHRQLMLAGGLDPTNVTRALAEVAPWGVDVASGVESSPGFKDADKVAAFVAAVRGFGR